MDSAKGELLVYQTDDGQVKIDVRLEDETIWLTQQLMAELFQTTKQNIGQHLKNVFSEGELLENSVVKKFFTTAVDGKNTAWKVILIKQSSSWRTASEGRKNEPI